MESTLENILKLITLHPEDIKIEREEPTFGNVVLHISVNDEDKGVVIGKNGRTIKALKDIIAIKAIKENKRVMLKIQ